MANVLKFQINERSNIELPNSRVTKIGNKNSENKFIFILKIAFLEPNFSFAKLKKN